MGRNGQLALCSWQISPERSVLCLSDALLWPEVYLLKCMMRIFRRSVRMHIYAASLNPFPSMKLPESGFLNPYLQIRVSNLWQGGLQITWPPWTDEGRQKTICKSSRMGQVLSWAVKVLARTPHPPHRSAGFRAQLQPSASSFPLMQTLGVGGMVAAQVDGFPGSTLLEASGEWTGGWSSVHCLSVSNK